MNFKQGNSQGRIQRHNFYGNKPRCSLPSQHTSITETSYLLYLHASSFPVMTHFLSLPRCCYCSGYAYLNIFGRKIFKDDVQCGEGITIIQKSDLFISCQLCFWEQRREQLACLFEGFLLYLPAAVAGWFNQINSATPNLQLRLSLKQFWQILTSWKVDVLDLSTKMVVKS